MNQSFDETANFSVLKVFMNGRKETLKYAKNDDDKMR